MALLLSIMGLVPHSLFHVVPRKALRFQQFFLFSVSKGSVVLLYLTQTCMVACCDEDTKAKFITDAVSLCRDDMNIFTIPQCITAWLSLLSIWGSLSGVTLNFTKCLLNLWSNTKNAANVSGLQQLLRTHPCPAYSNAGIFNSLTNKSGWRFCYLIELMTSF